VYTDTQRSEKKIINMANKQDKYEVIVPLELLEKKDRQKNSVFIN